jgi:hypothetical protein
MLLNFLNAFFQKETADSPADLPVKGEGSIVVDMAFLLPMLIIAAVLLAAPQIAIGLVIVGVAVGLSVAISKVIFALTGHPTSR